MFNKSFIASFLVMSGMTTTAHAAVVDLGTLTPQTTKTVFNLFWGGIG